MSGNPAVQHTPHPHSDPAAGSEPLDAETRAFLRAVGRRIRLLRYERELTQEELGTAVGISRNFVSLIEHGEHGMNLVRLFALARALEIEPAQLLRPTPQR